MSAIREAVAFARPADEATYPYQRAEKSFRVDAKLSEVFCELIGDKNPIHHSTEAAKEAGFGKEIAPGMLVMSLVSGFVEERFPKAVVRQFLCDFEKPVHFGEDVAVALWVVEEQKKRLMGCKKITLDFAICDSERKRLMGGTIKVVVRL